jgi:hypothetical protein
MTSSVAVALADAKTPEALISAWDRLFAERAAEQIARDDDRFPHYLGSMVSAFIPLGRIPFLPYTARSGWQLLTVLNSRYGFDIRGSDLMYERDIIRLCLDYCEKKGVRA